MTQKCHLCKKEITTTFLDKLNGTIIKILEDKTPKKFYICSSCQREHKDKLIEKLQ